MGLVKIKRVRVIVPELPLWKIGNYVNIICNYAMNITKMDVKDIDITHISAQLLAPMFLNIWSFHFLLCEGIIIYL